LRLLRLSFFPQKRKFTKKKLSAAFLTELNEKNKRFILKSLNEYRVVEPPPLLTVMALVLFELHVTGL